LEAPGPTGPLNGTLLVPDLKSFPVALIIPGSGLVDRDGNSPSGLKASTYKLLAEGLALRGVATLRIDKRGMFASKAATPDVNAVTISDNVVDIHSWVDVIRRKTGVACVWLLGHSEGGLVAMVAAREQTTINGLILVATAGRPVGEVVREQLKNNPANGSILDQALSAVDMLERGQRVNTVSMHPALQKLFNPAIQGYWINIFSYDPNQVLSGYSEPVLLLQGLRDIQVGEGDARLLKQAVPKANLVLLPNVNHVLKSVTSDDRSVNVATYTDPSLPLALGVIDAIAGFVTGEAQDVSANNQN